MDSVLREAQTSQHLIYQHAPFLMETSGCPTTNRTHREKETGSVGCDLFRQERAESPDLGLPPPPGPIGTYLYAVLSYAVMVACGQWCCLLVLYVFSIF